MIYALIDCPGLVCRYYSIESPYTLLDGKFYVQKEKKNERSVWSAGSVGAPTSTADVAETWLREINGTIHQLVIKQLEAAWECVEKNNDREGTIGVLADELEDGSV
jgi:hypothetical protein